MARCRWAGGQLLVLWALGVEVAGRGFLLSPASIASSFPTIVYNRYIGPQTLDEPLVNKSLAVFAGSPPPDEGQLACDGVAGSVLLASKASSFWSTSDELRMVTEAHRCGAVAVMRSQTQSRGVRSYVGIQYFVNEEDCCRSEGSLAPIPLFVVWHADLDAAVEAVDAGLNVTLSILAEDRNNWVHDMYRHPVFIAFARILLPIADTAVAITATRALVLHTRCCTPQHHRHETVFTVMKPYIIFALVLNILGCMVRAVYCAVGPFFCNGNLTLLESHFLVNISSPMQLPVIFVVAAVFHRITSMRSAHNRPSAQRVGVVGVFCLAIFVLELVAAYKRGSNQGMELYLVVSGALTNVTVIVASVVFLLRGGKFLSRMKQMQRMRKASMAQQTDQTKRTRLAFTRSIVCGALGLMLQFVCAAVGTASHTVFFTPTGFATLSVLYFASYTISALFFTTAFAPTMAIVAVHRGSASSQGSGQPKQPMQPTQPRAMLVDDNRGSPTNKDRRRAGGGKGDVEIPQVRPAPHGALHQSNGDGQGNRDEQRSKEQGVAAEHDANDDHNGQARAHDESGQRGGGGDEEQGGADGADLPTERSQ